MIYTFNDLEKQTYYTQAGDILPLDASSYIIYTDGSYLEEGSNKCYGSAFTISTPNNSPVCFAHSDANPNFITQRNVAGEVSAALFAFYFVHKNLKNCRSCHVFHDYTGIGNWAMGSWKAKNQLTQMYRDFYMKHIKPYINTTFTHVKGHSGDEFNDLVDSLANQAAREFLQMS